jgi:hypothetical protein
MQRKIPSNRVFRGIATIERTWKNAAFEGQLHLHALLWGVVDNARDPQQFMSEVANKAFSKLKDHKGRRMVRPSNIDLQYVYASERVIEYILKDTGKAATRRSRPWLITSNGFDTTTDYFN